MVRLLSGQRVVMLLLGVLAATGSARAQARVWEEDLEIPTWQLGPAEVNPTFSWSSSRQEVYPYPYKEILTDEKSGKTYIACWLENEFIKVLVLPEIGGRLHGAQDKTNGYNFFYWQPTIKPALVGMTGAWISGGIEWNFPHGHRPTGFSRVQHRLVENPDGSKTVWVGEPELVFRMRWIVGLTIYPGKSVIEAKVRLFNSSPIRHSFQMWTTTATNANEEYQLIFPTRLMTGHGKTEYFSWPVHEGVDISWWKNVPNAASYFAIEKAGFFGGWDHGKKAGTVIAGNPDVVIGKKFWTWGTSPFGRLWEPILTEGEGPYAEPQAGAYSDNQPDYHWLEPGEVKSYSHFFFPVRDIGPFKMASKEGALNLEVSPEGIRLGVYSTSVLESARVVLKKGNDEVFNRAVDLDPGSPLVESISMRNPGSATAFRLVLMDVDGREILAYSPHAEESVELPVPKPPLPRPSDIQSNDELWHAGDWYYKFREPERGRRYFEEAVRRDPHDSRSRLSLAEMAIKRADFGTALEDLDFAAVRDPDNGRLHYLRGLALERMHRDDEAVTSYFRTVHFEDYLARAYQRLAVINLRHGRSLLAAQQAALAIDKNALNSQLWALRAAALRRAGNLKAAEEASLQCLALDPLDAWGINELTKLNPGAARDQGVETRDLLHNAQTALEFALSYADAGLYEDALELLASVENDALTRYYRAYFCHALGRKEEASRLFREARSSSVDYSFAFRLEGLDVFETALSYDPNDGKAYYFKGLIYAKVANVERAVQSWKRAVELDPKNARAWRDLGLALVSSQDSPGEAWECYQRAYELAPDDSRILLELDEVAQRLGHSPEQRLAFLKQRLDVVRQRDALLGEFVDLQVAAGEYAEALAALQSNHFNSWEGNYSIHNVYMEAAIGLAERESDPRKALEYYRTACEYPLNLEVAPREPDLRGFLYYPMALLHREIGEAEEAGRLLRHTSQESTDQPTLGTYYQALAKRELAEKTDSEKLLAGLESEGKALVEARSEAYRRMNRTMQEALGHYYLAKVAEARGDAAGEEQHLGKARELVPGIERQAVMIAQRTYARAHQ